MPGQTRVGPSNGALLAAGGGSLGPEILRKFIALAGGPSAPITIVPTGDEEDYYGPYSPYMEEFVEAGGLNLSVLHTRDRNVADSEEFLTRLRGAQGVWFTGGRHWRCTDVYLNTRTHEELFALLDRGGVIGGSSGGATLQGAFMIRGDTSGHEMIIGDHVEGFGFLRNVSVDQHHLARNRHFDMVEVVEAHPELLGIGIDEGTAIVVRGDELEVIGTRYVAIYDNRRIFGKTGRFYFLKAGDRYNMRTREIMDPEDRSRGFHRLRDQAWQVNRTSVSALSSAPSARRKAQE